MDDMRLTTIQDPSSPENQLDPEKQREAEKGAGLSFQAMLKDSLEEVNALQNQADQAIQELAQGRSEDLHRTMVMIEKANLSFKLMMQVRNKLLEAYQEIMRLHA